MTCKCDSCGDLIPEYESVYSDEKFNVCESCVIEEGMENIFEQLRDR